MLDSCRLAKAIVRTSKTISLIRLKKYGLDVFYWKIHETFLDFIFILSKHTFFYHLGCVHVCFSLNAYFERSGSIRVESRSIFRFVFFSFFYPLVLTDLRLWVLTVAFINCHRGKGVFGWKLIVMRMVIVCGQCSGFGVYTTNARRSVANDGFM